jgi:Spy/CpxP family protein refolding chaperone
MKTRALLLAAALLASPLAAQSAPSAPPPPPMMAGPGGPGGPGAMAPGARMFPSMSDAGRQIVLDAMRGQRPSNEERAKVEAAREKMLAVLSADRFDANALKAAMEEERAAAETTHARRQAAMLAAFGKLSPADRKAFATDSLAMKNRMAERLRQFSQGWGQRRGMAGGMGGWRRGHGGPGGPGAPGGMMPPPPPPGPNGDADAF